MRRFVGISVALQAGIASDPPHALPKIGYRDHHDTADAFATYFDVPVSALPEGEYCAVKRCELSTHNGTHVDAPYHYFSSMNHRLKEGGEASARIDELPLELFLQPAVKLDCRHYEDGHVLQPDDMAAELRRIDRTLSPLEILVINTRRGCATTPMTTWTQAAASAAMPHSGCWSRACASSEPTDGGGMRHSRTRAASYAKPATCR